MSTISGCGSKSDALSGSATVSDSSAALIQEDITELNQELNGTEIYQLSSEELEAMLAEGVITAEESNEIRLLLN